MNKKDLVKIIRGDQPTKHATMVLFLENLDEALETLDVRLSCLLKTRYYKGMSLKQTGLHIVNTGAMKFGDAKGTFLVEKKPCEGITPERARQMEWKAIRLLRDPNRQRILKGEWKAKDFFALYGDKRV